jgi:hypothetical protein
MKHCQTRVAGNARDKIVMRGSTMSKLFHRVVLAGLVAIGGAGVANTASAHDYYGRPVYSGCAPRPAPYYGSYYGYSAHRPGVVVVPSYGLGSNYSSFYRGYNGVGGLTPSWGGYGVGGFPIGGSFGGGGAFPRGGSFGGGSGFSLYIGR